MMDGRRNRKITTMLISTNEHKTAHRIPNANTSQDQIWLMTQFRVIQFPRLLGCGIKKKRFTIILGKKSKLQPFGKRLPRVLQYAGVQTNNTAQSLLPHLSPGLINGYTVTANRLLIPYAPAKNRQSLTNQNLIEAT